MMMLKNNGIDHSKHDETVHINYELLGSNKDFSAKTLKDEYKIDLSYLFNIKK